MDELINRKIFVISAPSAGGKTTIIKRLISLLDGSLSRVITCTTREKRDGEIDGIHYKFMSVGVYKKLLGAGKFAENAEVYGNFYGVLKEDLFSEGHKIISLDSKGVYNFKRCGVKAKYILVTPPSLEVLRQRLAKRGSETEEEMDLRLAEAKKEMEQSKDFDFVVVNDELEKAIDDCKKIIMGEIK
jgi:guanylate kinase